MGKRTLGLGALVVAATLSMAPAQAWGADDPTEPGRPAKELGANEPRSRGRAVTDAVAERSDVEVMAKQYDWPADATAVYLKESRTFSGLAAQLSAKFPNVYAGAIYGERPGDGASLRFVGTVPPVAAKFAQRDRAQDRARRRRQVQREDAAGPGHTGSRRAGQARPLSGRGGHLHGRRRRRCDGER